MAIIASLIFGRNRPLSEVIVFHPGHFQDCKDSRTVNMSCLDFSRKRDIMSFELITFPWTLTAEPKLFVGSPKNSSVPHPSLDMSIGKAKGVIFCHSLKLPFNSEQISPVPDREYWSY